MGFGSQSPYSNVRSVPYPFDVIPGTPDSLRPVGSRVFIFDNFTSPQLSWVQKLIGGGTSTSVNASFIRQAPLLAFPGSSGALQIYAGTATGTGNSLIAGSPTCDARRFGEFQGSTKVGCEVWYTFLRRMNDEEGLLGIGLSQYDGVVDNRLQIRMDHVFDVSRVDYETSQMAPSSNLTFSTLANTPLMDGYFNGKWNHVVLEADFGTGKIIRVLVNAADYTAQLAGKSIATQTLTSHESPKTGVEFLLYNQVVPVRGAEYFIGQVLAYILPS